MLPYRPDVGLPRWGATVHDADRDADMDVDMDVDDAAEPSDREVATSARDAAARAHATSAERAAKEVGEGCLLLHERLHRHPSLASARVDPGAERLMALALRCPRAGALDDRHPGLRADWLGRESWLSGQWPQGAEAFVDDLRVATTVHTGRHSYRPMSTAEAKLAESLLARDVSAPRRSFSWSLLRQLHDEIPILMDLDLDELRGRDPAGTTRAWIREMLSSPGTTTHGAVKRGTTLRVVATQDPPKQLDVLKDHGHLIRTLILQRPEQADAVPACIADWVQRVDFKQLEQEDLRALARVLCSFPNLVKIGLPALGRELVAENGERVDEEEGSWIWYLKGPVDGMPKKGRVDGLGAFDRLRTVWETDFAELRPFAERFSRMHRDEIMRFLGELEPDGVDDDTASEEAVGGPAPGPSDVEQVRQLLIQTMKDDELAIRCVFLSRESDDLETRFQGMKRLAESLARHPLPPLRSTLARGQDGVTPPREWIGQRLWSITAPLAQAQARRTGAVLGGTGVGTLVRALDQLPGELLTRAMAAKRDLALQILAPVQRQLSIADLAPQDAAFVLGVAELSPLLGLTLRVDRPSVGRAARRLVSPETLPAGAVAALRSIRQWVEGGRMDAVDRLRRERWYQHLVAITHDPEPLGLAGVLSTGATGQTVLDPPPREPLLKLMRALYRSLPLTLDTTGGLGHGRQTLARQLGERFFPIEVWNHAHHSPVSFSISNRRGALLPLDAHLRTFQGPGLQFMGRMSASQLTQYVAGAHVNLPSLVGITLPEAERITIQAADLASRGDPPQDGSWVPQSNGRWIRQGFFQQVEAAIAACWMVPDLVLQPERMTRLLNPAGAGHAVLTMLAQIADGVRAVNDKLIERRALPLVRTVLAGAQEDEAFAVQADSMIARADGNCLDARLSTLWELSTLREFGEIESPKQAVDCALHLACRRRADVAVAAVYSDFEEQLEEALLLKLAVTERLNARLVKAQARPTPAVAFASAGVNGSDWRAWPNRVEHLMWADRLIDDEIRMGLPLVRMELEPDAPGGPALNRTLAASPAFLEEARARQEAMQSRYERAMAQAADGAAEQAANDRLTEDHDRETVEKLRHVNRVRDELLAQLPLRLRPGAEVPF